MSVVLFLVTGLLVAGSLLFLLAVVLPVRLELQLVKEEALQFQAVLRLFGRFGPRIKLRKNPDSVRKKPKAPRKRRFRTGKALRRPQRVAQAAFHLAIDILHRIHIDAASLDLRFGFGDPAETGQAFGMLAPFIYGPSPSPKMSLHVQPVFDTAVLRGRAEMTLKLVPAALLIPSVRFGWAAFGPKR